MSKRIAFINFGETFTSFFLNNATAARQWIFKDRNGTIADDTDLAAINSDLSAINLAIAGKQPTDADLTAIAAITPSNDDIIQRKSGAWTNRTMAQLLADLGVSSLDSANPVTSGGTITLDFSSKQQRVFNGATSFTGSKTIALSNSSNALAFTFNFQVTGSGAAITFPSSAFKSSDSRFASNVLTITGAGYYEVTAVYDSVNSFWRLKAEIDGGVL